MQSKGKTLLPSAGVDPTSPTNGQIWYRSDTNKFRGYENGAAVNLISAGGGSVVTGSVSIAFTDGDTARRIVVSDVNVTAASKIIGTVERPTIAEVDDRGFIYIATVISVASGSFNLFIICLDIDGKDAILDPPNETIEFNYMIA